MKTLTAYTSVYFVGAGGIGMSALVRYCLAKGYAVAGYDKTPSTLTSALEKEGARLFYDESVELIPAPFRDAATTLVVYTPAVPDSHAGLTYFRENGRMVRPPRRAWRPTCWPSRRWGAAHSSAVF